MRLREVDLYLVNDVGDDADNDDLNCDDDGINGIDEPGEITELVTTNLIVTFSFSTFSTNTSFSLVNFK